MNRRSVLAGTAAAGVVALSGCLSTALNAVTSLESTPASVEPSVVDATGYGLVGVEEVVNEEDVEVAAVSDTIVVTSHLTEYEKSVGIEGVATQPTAMFSVLSTPKIRIAGRTFNPVAEMSSQALVEMIADNYESIDDLRYDTDETVTVLDQSVEKAQFIADARFEGIPLELKVHVTEAVELGDDLVVAIGVYPNELSQQEAANIRELTEAVSDEPPDAAVEDESNQDAESEDSTGDDEDATDDNETEDETDIDGDDLLD